VQEVAPEARAVPTGQGVHTPSPAALKVLTEQEVQGPVAPPDTVFAGQVLHVVAPVALFHVPGAHTVQEAALVLVENVPAAQGVQSVPSLKVPAGQPPQLTPDWAMVTGRVAVQPFTVTVTV